MDSKNLLGLDIRKVWDITSAYLHLKSLGAADTKRTAERRLQELNFFPQELSVNSISDITGKKPTPSVLKWQIEEARKKRKLVLFVQMGQLPNGRVCLHANDARGARYWIPFSEKPLTVEELRQSLSMLQTHLEKPIALFPHGQIIDLIEKTTSTEYITCCMLGYPPKPFVHQDFTNITKNHNPHLEKLEAESIHIIREAVAESNNPAMLYSIGKDSSVMLHLARKAFYPSLPPMPLVHVDTRWKFQEMYLFRDFISKESGMKLIVHINPEAIEKNINPFDHGSAIHTDITKTEGLKQVLDKNGYDVVFGGARRDEEKSRAKERVFSFRTATHRWDPKNQRPELWNLYNTRKNTGESIRVFPLSNWTELDIWQYIERENIPVVPLYFAKKRPVVIRNGMIIQVDDDRIELLPEEEPKEMTIRFRTLGCYPLTGAIESDAKNVSDIIAEILQTKNSERQGRAIDTDSSASMEKKKQEGYF